MLDVHPPEHAAHTWRDFFIHIATIVVGLLIAISLEQTVEFFHHRSEIRETRERIRTELESNRKLIGMDVARLKIDSAHWVDYGQQLSQPGIDATAVSKMDFDWDLQLESNSAWELSRQSAIFSYMPVEENEQYAYLYRLLGENYATSVLYIADVRMADAIVQRIRRTHILANGDRDRLLALLDSLDGRARNQLDLYDYLNTSLTNWLDRHIISNRS